jgi:hypothetical protein
VEIIKVQDMPLLCVVMKHEFLYRSKNMNCMHEYIKTRLQKIALFKRCSEYIIRMEVKLSLRTCTIHRRSMGSGGKAPHILNFSTIMMYMVSFTLRFHYSRCPMNRRLDGLQSRSGCGDPCLCRESNRGDLACSESFYRLNHPGRHHC